MKANKNEMLAFPIDRIHPDAGMPFPLFIFLPKNDRMVRLRLPGEALGRELFEDLRKLNHSELWVPKEYEEAFSKLIASEALISQGAGHLEDLSPLLKLLASLKKITEKDEETRRELAEKMREAEIGRAHV